jgi:hypothetical protein
VWLQDATLLVLDDVVDPHGSHRKILEMEVWVWLIASFDGGDAPCGNGGIRHTNMGTEVDDRVAPHSSDDAR